MYTVLFNSFTDFLNANPSGGVWPSNIFQAEVSELWYVEEYDLLALALDGRIKVRSYQLGCTRTQDSEDQKHN